MEVKCLKCGYLLKIENIKVSNRSIDVLKKCPNCNTINNLKEYNTLMYKKEILNYLKDRLKREENEEIIGIDEQYEEEKNMKYGAINMLEEIIFYIECLHVKGE